MLDDITEPLKVAIYLRVSTDDQVEKYGLPMQLDSIQALIQSKGKFGDGRAKYVFAGDQYLYQDEGISGTTPIEERPAFAQLIEDISNAPRGNRPFDVVAVYKIDRFARKLKVLMDVLDFFEEQQLKMLSANESIDTGTPFGRAVLGIIGVIAELEIETFRQRSMDGRRQAIQRGVYMGGAPPYGYIKNVDKTLETVPSEVAVVKEIYRLFLQERYTMQSIASYLTQQEYLSPAASAVMRRKKRGEVQKSNSLTFWREAQVKDILSNEIYTGVYYYGKYVKGKRVSKVHWKRSDYVFPIVIEKADFLLVQKQLAQSRTRSVNKSRAKKNKHIYLLGGLLRCESCVRNEVASVFPTWIGEPKKMKNTDGTVKNLYYYKCGRRNTKKYSENCCVTTLPADQVEEIVLDQVFTLLDDPRAVINYQNNLKSQENEQAVIQKKRQRFLELSAAVPHRRERLLEQHEQGHITSAELKEKLSELEEKQKHYTESIEQLEMQIGKIRLSNNYLATLDHFKKQYHERITEIKKDRVFLQNLLASLIDQVVVVSRPVEETDVISGRKKKSQELPHRLQIHFRLPQDMLQQAFFKFGVKDAVL